MFCKNCGAPSETEVCPNCASQAQPEPQAPVSSDFFQQTVKPNLHYILAGIALVAFLWGILNLFSVFNVKANVTMGDMSESEYGTVSEAAEMLDESDSSAAPIYIGNIIFGLTNLAVAAIGIFYFLKINKNMPYYDNFIGSKLSLRPAFMMGALGAIGVILQFILYLFSGVSESFMGVTVDLSIGINWTSWVLLVIYGGIAALDKFVLEKKTN